MVTLSRFLQSRDADARDAVEWVRGDGVVELEALPAGDRAGCFADALRRPRPDLAYQDGNQVMPRQIDLNSDLGEGYGAWKMGDDEAMLRVVSSANVACGFHAGDPATILATLAAAARRKVAIGAHVSYPDRVGFGRRSMDISPADLSADVIYQIGALQGLAAAAGTRVSYVKPHGALYNSIVNDARQGDAVIAGIKAVDPSLALMALAGAPILARAEAAGLTTVTEAFADRAYRPDGRLVSRQEKDAVLHDPQVVAARVLRLAEEGVIEAVDGSTIHLDARSVCIHGDSPGAVQMAIGIREVLLASGVTIAAFSEPHEPHRFCRSC